MNKYLIWVPVMLVVNSLNCYFAIKWKGVSFWKLHFTLASLALVPAWSLAAYLSKNIIFDGMLYDLLLIISGVTVCIVLGEAVKFTVWNFAGLALTIIGLVLMKI